MSDYARHALLMVLVMVMVMVVVTIPSDSARVGARFRGQNRHFLPLHLLLLHQRPGRLGHPRLPHGGRSAHAGRASSGPSASSTATGSRSPTPASSPTTFDGAIGPEKRCRSVCGS